MRGGWRGRGGSGWKRGGGGGGVVEAAEAAHTPHRAPHVPREHKRLRHAARGRTHPPCELPHHRCKTGRHRRRPRRGVASHSPLLRARPACKSRLAQGDADECTQQRRHLEAQIVLPCHCLRLRLRISHHQSSVQRTRTNLREDGGTLGEPEQVARRAEGAKAGGLEAPHRDARVRTEGRAGLVMWRGRRGKGAKGEEYCLKAAP